MAAAFSSLSMKRTMIVLSLIISVILVPRNCAKSDRKLLQMAWEYKPVPRPPGYDVQPVPVPVPQPAVPVPVPVPVPAPLPTDPSPWIRVPSFMPAVPMPTPLPTMPTPAPVVIEVNTLPPYGGELKCDKPGLCANTMHKIENPPNGFKMECGTKESCTNSKITLYYPPEQNGRMSFRPDQYIDIIKVNEGALKGSTITVDNRMSSTVWIKLIECGGGFCEGATFVLWNAQIMDFKCDPAKGCGSGCMVVGQVQSAVTCNSLAL